MVESGRLPKTGKIRASTGEGSGRVPEKGGIRASTGEGFGQVPGKGGIGDRTRARYRGTTELKGGRDAITKAQNT